MLHNGGAERWLVDLCPAGRAENIAMDIVVTSEIEGLFARLAKERGIPVYYCPGGHNPWQFAKNFRKLLRQHGPYDAVHSHLHAFSAFPLLAARMEGIPVRVVHSHNVIRNSYGSLMRRAYIVFARTLLRSLATAGLAPGAAAAADLFGEKWQSDPRWRVLPCGVDLAPFRAPIGAESTRAALGIPEQALVLGSVGRLTPEKNSEFLVDVLAALLQRGADAYLLVIGEGALRARMEAKAREGGYSERLLLPGMRSDVPAVLRSVIDVFVFPSPPPPRGDEALAIAVVEAQAAGLPCVISDGIPPEAILVPELVLQIKADDGAEAWADAVLQQRRRRDPEAASMALAVIERSQHNGELNVKALAAIYRGGA
jgi:glycosyltransferase involved in cell wall biosynthesis